MFDRALNSIRTGLRQTNANQFKIITFLEWFNALVPYFATLSFLKKLGQALSHLRRCNHVVPIAATQNPRC